MQAAYIIVSAGLKIHATCPIIVLLIHSSLTLAVYGYVLYNKRVLMNKTFFMYFSLSDDWYMNFSSTYFGDHAPPWPGVMHIHDANQRADAKSSL